MTEGVTALGLMSGTSIDGIDAALLRTDGERVADFLPWFTVPYDPRLRSALRQVLGGKGPVREVERALTDAHALAVEKLLWLAQIETSRVRVIGFHGHTILHQPENRKTWQIGDGARLAARCGIDTVCDFRSADVAAGGQGAPLAPIYHAALASDLEKPLAVLNVGGVANVTWIGATQDDLIAFDTGPGNALIDDWVLRHTGRAMDVGGELARSGRIDGKILGALLDVPYFDRRPPKSLDRDDFSLNPLAVLDIADGAATLTAFTAQAVARALEHLPAAPKRWLVCGGGRHNKTLMACLAEAVAATVEPVEAVGWRGDALEAEAFAFMAVRNLRGLPITRPGTTGVSAPLCGGVLHPGWEKG